MKPLVYLCGPINCCGDKVCHEWREAFKEAYGGPTLDPMRRDYRGIEDVAYREIVELDKHDIRISDVVLVNYGGPSVGTSMEMFYAHSLGKPVVLWTLIPENISPWLKYHSTTIVHSLRDARRAVEMVYARERR